MLFKVLSFERLGWSNFMVSRKLDWSCFLRYRTSCVCAWLRRRVYWVVNTEQCVYGNSNVTPTRCATEIWPSNVVARSGAPVSTLTRGWAKKRRNKRHVYLVRSCVWYARFVSPHQIAQIFYSSVAKIVVRTFSNDLTALHHLRHWLCDCRRCAYYLA